MHIKNLFVKKERGSGAFVLGTVLTLFCFAFLMLYIQMFMTTQQDMDTQMAADAVADGTAVYMHKVRSTDYDMAIEQAMLLSERYEEIAGVKVHGVTLDMERLEKDREVSVALTTEQEKLAVNTDENGMVSPIIDTITRIATTKIGRTKVGYINWAIAAASDNRTTYSQAQRTFRMYNPNNYQMDCSAFVWFALRSDGYALTGRWPFTTVDEATKLQELGFVQYPYGLVRNSLEPGDILIWWEGGRPETSSGNNGHTAIYIGEGKIAEETPPRARITSVNNSSAWNVVLRPTVDGTGEKHAYPDF